MKEVIYKNITGPNPRKREISIEETSDRSKIRMVKKWISKYYLKDMFMAQSKAELEHWIELDKERSAVRKYHILRHIDRKKRINKVLFKMAGEFYIVDRLKVFKVFCVNILKIQICE